MSGVALTINIDDEIILRIDTNPFYYTLLVSVLAISVCDTKGASFLKEAYNFVKRTKTIAIRC